MEEIADIMKTETAPTLKRLFRQTTTGWSNHPSWRQHLTRHSDEISMEVWTEDSKYGLVNAGSPKHSIPAKRGGLLRFKPGYRASTRPGRIQSQRAYRSGPYVTAQSIPMHPGFEARKFDELVAETYSPSFRKDVQQAIDNAARRVGSG